MWASGEVRYSGGKVVWLAPRHVLLLPMTAVAVRMDNGENRNGRIIGYVRGTAAGDSEAMTEPVSAMASITACYSNAERERGTTEPRLGEYYAPMRVVVQLDGELEQQVTMDLDRCLLPRCWWDAEQQLQRPSVAQAEQAQAARAFESWRWSDALEELLSEVGQRGGSLAEAQAAQQTRLAQLQDDAGEAGGSMTPEPEPEPEVAELDVAAVAAAGVELLPEMSDDWMAAFR